jgi:hypothetical protein
MNKLDIRYTFFNNDLVSSKSVYKNSLKIIDFYYCRTRRWFKLFMKLYKNFFLHIYRNIGLGILKSFSFKKKFDINDENKYLICLNDASQKTLSSRRAFIPDCLFSNRPCKINFLKKNFIVKNFKSHFFMSSYFRNLTSCKSNIQHCINRACLKKKIKKCNTKNSLNMLINSVNLKFILRYVIMGYKKKPFFSLFHSQITYQGKSQMFFFYNLRNFSNKFNALKKKFLVSRSPLIRSGYYNVVYRYRFYKNNILPNWYFKLNHLNDEFICKYCSKKIFRGEIFFKKHFSSKYHLNNVLRKQAVLR